MDPSLEFDALPPRLILARLLICPLQQEVDHAVFSRSDVQWGTDLEI